MFRLECLEDELEPPAHGSQSVVYAKPVNLAQAGPGFA